MKTLKANQQEKGFTLIELIIVVAIICIIVAIVGRVISDHGFKFVS